MPSRDSLRGARFNISLIDFYSAQYLGVIILTRFMPGGNLLEETKRKENSIDYGWEADQLS